MIFVACFFSRTLAAFMLLWSEVNILWAAIWRSMLTFGMWCLVETVPGPDEDKLSRYSTANQRIGLDQWSQGSTCLHTNEMTITANCSVKPLHRLIPRRARLLIQGEKDGKLNSNDIPIVKGIMSSVFAVCVAILLAAIDMFGENTRVHFIVPVLLGLVGCSVRMGGIVDVRFSGRVRFGGDVDFKNGGMEGKVDFGIGGSVRMGGKVDASKLSQIVGEDTNSDSTSVRMSKRTAGKKAGMMICNAVTMMRRFCSSQFFHSNNPNCSTFDIVMVTSDAALSSV